MRNFILLCVMCFFISKNNAQETENTEGKFSKLNLAYEASAQHPYGLPNPEAPVTENEPFFL